MRSDEFKCLKCLAEWVIVAQDSDATRVIQPVQRCPFCGVEE